MDAGSLEQAKLLQGALQRLNSRIVLAESCTAGRVAATLGCLPGVSQQLCGSFVVYRCDSKTRWLGVPAEMLADSAVGPVSPQTTQWLAKAAARATPESHFGLAVTGDVGPGAPAETDGHVFVTLYDVREDLVHEGHCQLRNPPPRSVDDVESRSTRLDEATRFVLSFANQWLSTC